MAATRPVVLNASIKNHKDLNPEILAIIFVQPPAGNDLCHEATIFRSWMELSCDPVSLNRCTVEATVFE
jgi:hypothetical protein